LADIDCEQNIPNADNMTATSLRMRWSGRRDYQNGQHAVGGLSLQQLQNLKSAFANLSATEMAALNCRRPVPASYLMPNMPLPPNTNIDLKLPNIRQSHWAMAAQLQHQRPSVVNRIDGQLNGALINGMVAVSPTLSQSVPVRSPLLMDNGLQLSRTVTIGEQYHMAKSALSHAQSITCTPGTIRIIFTISTARAARVPFVLRRRRPSATRMLRIFRLTLREMFPLSASSFPRLFLSAFPFCSFYLFAHQYIISVGFSYIFYLLRFVFPQSEYQLRSSASLSCGLTLLCKFWTRRAT
jgi:hypothetical protein